jgi:sarcosine oxidase
VETSRQLTVEYVRQCLQGVGEEPLEELYCDIVEGWGDGYGVKRNGAFLVLYGDNLFKFAPVLGCVLAEAALSGATPRSVGLPATV